MNWTMSLTLNLTLNKTLTLILHHDIMTFALSLTVTSGPILTMTPGPGLLFKVA